jgi:adenylyltransferase/sulfurtransferase
MHPPELADIHSEITLEADRYERLKGISWWSQSTLAAARVIVVGAGALGNEILKNLALLGLGRVLLIDRDTVSMSNLSRSVLFRPEDAGQPKSLVAARAVAAINPEVRVFPLQGDVAWDLGLGLLRRADLILGGLDSIGARLALNKACMQVGRPWIDAALYELNGIIRVYHPESACFECGVSAGQFLRLNLSYSCQLLPYSGAEDIVPTTPTSASLTAALQIQEGLRWLHGQPAAQSFAVEYQAETYQLSRRLLPHRESCYAHEAIPADSLIEAPGLSHQSPLGDVLAFGAGALGEAVRLELDREVVYFRACGHCGYKNSDLRPRAGLSHREGHCPDCGRLLDLRTRHHFGREEGAFYDYPLAALGVPPLHILKIRAEDSGQVAYIELYGDVQQHPLGAFVQD